MDKAGVHARPPGAGLTAPTPTGQHGQGRGQGGPHGQPPGRGQGGGRGPSGGGYGAAAVALAGGRAGQSPGAGPSPTYEQVVLADAPVVFWQLDETSGTTAADDSGNGYDGTYVLGGGSSLGNTPLITVGHSVYLASGSSGRVQVASQAAFNANGHVSGEVWIKTTEAVDGSEIIGADDGTSRYFQFRLNGPTGGSNLILFDTGGGTHTLAGVGKINDNAAHHLVFTYDGATISLYLDGVLDNSTAASFALATSNPGLALGARYPGTGGNMFGYWDEFALYTTVLSASRVAAHYAAGT